MAARRAIFAFCLTCLAAAVWQAQIDDLAAALQQLREQGLRDQAEIAQLKAQMAELLANQPKQDF